MSSRRPYHRREALGEFMKTLTACQSTVHPQDLAFEPINYLDWMLNCDSVALWDLQRNIKFIKCALDNAMSSNPRGHYVQLRRHYLKYAEDAMRRRFTELASIQEKDVPF